MSGGQTPVDKFEESFQNCLKALAKEDTLTNVDRDEIRVDVEHTLEAFVEQAKFMEAYFLKKRLHIAANKPELLLKDDVLEMRLEVLRKEELARKNLEKVNYWQGILADLQTTAPPGSTQVSTTVTPVSSNAGSGPATPSAVGRPTPPPPNIQNLRPQGMGGTRGPGPGGFGGPSGSSGLQGPLAYLEKTASGIGMSDNR